jgi:hypothetical protein
MVAALVLAMSKDAWRDAYRILDPVACRDMFPAIAVCVCVFTELHCDWRRIRTPIERKARAMRGWRCGATVNGDAGDGDAVAVDAGFE